MTNNLVQNKSSQIALLQFRLTAAVLLVTVIPASLVAETLDLRKNADDAAASRQGEEALRPFTKLMGGEWRLTLLSGHTMFERWQWGPGRRSVISQTHGADGGGRPWRSMQIIYWHPQKKNLRMFRLSPDIPGLGRGVAEGTVTFDGTIAEGVFDLHQPGHPGRTVRKMTTRWTFEDANTYRSTLLEDDGKGVTSLGEWTLHRSRNLSVPTMVEAAAAMPHAELAGLRRLTEGTWQAVDASSPGQVRRTKTSLTWIPFVKAIHMRTVAISDEGKEQVLADTVLYYHVGLKRLRCFALLHNGGVVEGDLTVRDASRRFIGTLTEYGVCASRKLAVEVDWAAAVPIVHERVWEINDQRQHELIRDVRHR